MYVKYTTANDMPATRYYVMIGIFVDVVFFVVFIYACMCFFLCIEYLILSFVVFHPIGHPKVN